MQDDKQPLMMELAYILHKRNLIEVRRRRAKSKVHYYQSMKDCVVEYKKFASMLSTLKRDILKYTRLHSIDGDWAIRIKNDTNAAEAIASKIQAMKLKKMKPFKWLDKASVLNKLILKYKAEYATCRYETARLTCQTRKRVNRLTKLLNANINYQHGTGFVRNFSMNSHMEIIPAENFEAMYREVEANKAIEKMLKTNEKTQEDKK